MIPKFHYCYSTVILSFSDHFRRYNCTTAHLFLLVTYVQMYSYFLMCPPVFSSIYLIFCFQLNHLFIAMPTYLRFYNKYVYISTYIYIYQYEYNTHVRTHVHTHICKRNLASIIHIIISLMFCTLYVMLKLLWNIPEYSRLPFG